MGTTTERPLPQYLLADLPFVEDPLHLYATWRADGPLLKGGPKQWLVTRHADVAPLLRDRRLTHEMPRLYLEFVNGGPGPAADFRERSLLNRDGPDHTRLRRLMGQAFSGSLVRRLRDRVTELTDGLLTPLLDGQPFDVVADLAHPLPSLVICELLGIDHVDRDEVGRRAAELTAPGDLPRQNEALAWARQYLGAVLAERAPDPEGDLLQRMLAAEEGDDALSHEEIVDNAVLLFFAGFETTKHLIASGMVALNRFPAERRRLLDDPSSSTTAVEEFLRYDGPARVVSLVVVEPVTIGDRTIRPEQVLHLMLGSANHDEEVFADPGVLDIRRHPNPHVSFGGGVHHCLGAMLARLEADVVFRRLAERVRSLEATEAPTFEPQTIGRYRRVPVVARAC
jgi:cytochrome P450